MKEKEIEGVPLSKWQRLQEMKDMSKRFRVCFQWERAMDFTWHDTLKQAKEYVVGWIRDQGVLFDLENITIWDTHDNDRLVKFIDGDRLYKRYFRI